MEISFVGVKKDGEKERRGMVEKIFRKYWD